MRSQGHASIAWPVDLLRSTGERGRVVGFLMPRVQDMFSVIDLFVPKTRLEKCPLFTYQYLHRTARNIAAALAPLHARGYVVGDINELNILVSTSALVTLVDTDLFQVRDAGGKVYRCGVGKAEFTPPELQGRTLREVDRNLIPRSVRPCSAQLSASDGGHASVRRPVPRPGRSALSRKPVSRAAASPLAAPEENLRRLRSRRTWRCRTPSCRPCSCAALRRAAPPRRSAQRPRCGRRRWTERRGG